MATTAAGTTMQAEPVDLSKSSSQDEATAGKPLLNNNSINFLISNLQQASAAAAAAAAAAECGLELTKFMATAAAVAEAAESCS